MDNSNNRNNDHLGINKMGKNIRKSPLHQSNVGSNAARQQPQPQVYNISKSHFRDIVQQLTGSPSREPPPRPAQNPPKPQSQRLQKIRPPPLGAINRPHIPLPMPVHLAPPSLPQPWPVQFGQPSPTSSQALVPPTNSFYAESPISAYMRYLQNSMLNPSPLSGQPPSQQPLQPQHLQPRMHPQTQPQLQPQSHPQPLVANNIQGQPPLLPNPTILQFHSPNMVGLINPVNGAVHPVPDLPSSQINGSSPLPSPTSQFLLPSSSGYMNLLSPRSPYPLLSPGVQFPPLTPNFPFCPTAQSGILGPGPEPPPSPGLLFPLSPSGFLPLASPWWKNP